MARARSAPQQATASPRHGVGKGCVVAWTAKARQLSLLNRIRSQASKERGCVCVLQRVAERGSGLGRAARILNDLGRPALRGGRWTRKQVHRLAQHEGFDLTTGRFVPGQPAFDSTCGSCGDSLGKQPWCRCLPRPAGGIFDWFREDGFILPSPPPSRGGKRRLAKWRESLKRSGRSSAG